MKTVDIVFAGEEPYLQFVEVEREGVSVNVGEWVDRENGTSVLQIPDPDTLAQEIKTLSARCAELEDQCVAYKKQCEWYMMGAGAVSEFDKTILDRTALSSNLAQAKALLEKLLEMREVRCEHDGCTKPRTWRRPRVTLVGAPNDWCDEHVPNGPPMWPERENYQPPEVALIRAFLNQTESLGGEK